MIFLANVSKLGFMSKNHMMLFSSFTSDKLLYVNWHSNHNNFCRNWFALVVVGPCRDL